jgi:hypothetical protein
VPQGIREEASSNASGNAADFAHQWVGNSDGWVTVHDAVVIEATADRIDADVALTQEIMRRASRVVLGGHELRTGEMRTGLNGPRWFRSENVIPTEQARARQKSQSR